jgi:hypothetical protein
MRGARPIQLYYPVAGDKAMTRCNKIGLTPFALTPFADTFCSRSGLTALPDKQKTRQMAGFFNI